MLARDATNSGVPDIRLSGGKTLPTSGWATGNRSRCFGDTLSFTENARKTLNTEEDLSNCNRGFNEWGKVNRPRDVTISELELENLLLHKRRLDQMDADFFRKQSPGLSTTRYFNGVHHDLRVTETAISEPQLTIPRRCPSFLMARDDHQKVVATYRINCRENKK